MDTGGELGDKWKEGYQEFSMSCEEDTSKPSIWCAERSGPWWLLARARSVRRGCVVEGARGGRGDQPVSREKIWDRESCAVRKVTGVGSSAGTGSLRKCTRRG